MFTASPGRIFARVARIEIFVTIIFYYICLFTCAKIPKEFEIPKFFWPLMLNFFEQPKTTLNTIPMEQKKDYLERIFFEARMRGLCKTQSEFSELLGMHPSTISNALKGKEKYLTDSVVRRVQAWERQVLNREPSQPQPAPQEPARPDIVIPAATMDLYTSMAKSIDRLTALVERLQPGASAYSGAAAFAPKNYRIEK